MEQDREVSFPQFVKEAIRSFCVQAEDGIRYLTVTGVQTCALPISGFDVLRFNAGASEQIRDLFRIFGKINKFAQPIDGKFHANWRRNRKSFCAKSRMSGMSNRIIASRSIPRPNA